MAMSTSSTCCPSTQELEGSASSWLRLTRCERYAPRIGFDLRPNHKVCGPALALLEQLPELGVLKTAEKPLRSRGAPSTPPGDEPQKPETQLAYTAWDPCVPALAVALRLLQLRESRCKFYA